MAGWLVVNADDLGVSRGATLGIIKAHRDGIVTSASLATTTDFYEHAVESCVRTCPELGIGLHFTLTSGKPVSYPADVPLLMDERGFFRWRFTSLVSAVSIRKREALIDQIGLEVESQLQKLLRDGITPDHIDGERHVHLIPGIFEKVVAAAHRHGVKFIRAGSDVARHWFPNAEVRALALRGGFVRSWILSGLSRRSRRLLGHGVVSADRVASYFGSGRMDLLKSDVLEQPLASGVTEIMVHPGIPEESAGIDLGNHELERYLLLEDRRRELDFCIRAAKWIDRASLTNYTSLAAEVSRA
ncbi:MAG: ChbG/HpnK family deacetylase [Gemmatimonadaceae bacterium]